MERGPDVSRVVGIKIKYSFEGLKFPVLLNQNWEDFCGLFTSGSPDSFRELSIFDLSLFGNRSR